MRWRAARVWVWAIVVALPLQLALLHGHSHAPNEPEAVPHDGHAHAFHSDEKTHHHPHDAHGGHGHDQHDHDGHHAHNAQLAVEDGLAADTDAPVHNHDGDACWICWLLAALNALVLPILMCLLRGFADSSNRSFARTQVRASKIAFMLYLARAPPSKAIHI